MANNTENYTSRFKVDISDLKKGITEANKTIKTANAEFKNATAGMGDWSKSADGLTAKIKQQESVVEAEKKKLELLKEQLARLNQNQEDGKKIISELTQKYEHAASTYGETSEEAKEYAKQLTDAQAAQERNANAADDLRLKIISQDTAVKNAEAQVSRYQSALSDLQNHTETLTEKVQRQQSELDELKQKYANVAAEQGKDSEEAKELAGKISELSGELKENRDKLNDAEQAADDFDQSLDNLDDSADDTTNGSLSAFSVALGNLAEKIISAVVEKMKELITQTIEVGKTFDSSMSQVSAVSGATGEELDLLRDKAKEMGSTTKFTASEAADAFNYMAMAGWKTDDMLTSIDGVMNLAAASGEDLATTSDIVTDAMTALGMAADGTTDGIANATHFADVLAAASSNANTNVSMMGESFKYCAPAAGTLGYSAEDVALALGLMANSGIKASQAGTSLNTSLARLAKPTEEMQEYMAKLGLVTSETITKFDSAKIEKAQNKMERAADGVEQAQIKLNTAMQKYGEESPQIQKASADVEQAQIKLNDAVARYGENSSEAQQKALDLEKAQIKLNTAMSECGENSPKIQEAILNLEKAQSTLRDAEIDLAEAQKGETETVLGSNLALTNEKGEMKDLRETLVIMRDAFQNLTTAEQEEYASAIFGKNAMSGMLAIINAAPSDFEKLTLAVDNCNGKAQEMADTMLDNLGGDMTLLKSQLEGVQLAIYEKLEPSLRKGAEALGKLLDAFMVIVGHSTGVITAVTSVAAAVGTFLLIVNKQAIITAFTAGLTKIKTAFLAVNATMAANPIGLVIAAIAGLVTAFVMLWNRSEKFRNFWIGLWESIQETLFKFFDNWISGWTSIKEFFSKVWNDFQEIFQIGMDIVVGFASKAWEKIKSAWSSISSFFSGLWESVQETVWNAMDAVTGFFVSAKNKAESAWNGIVSFFAVLWNGIKAIFSTVADWINQNIFEPVKEFFRPVVTFFTQAWNILTELAQGCVNLILFAWGIVSQWFNDNVINPIKTFFADLWAAVSGFAVESWENVKAGWKIVAEWFNNNVIKPVANFFKALWNAVKTFALTTWDNIKTGWKAAGNWFNTSVITPIKNFFKALWTTIRTFALTAWDNIKTGWKVAGTWFNTSVITPVKNFFANMWTGVKNGAVQAWDGIKQTFAHVADWFETKFSNAWQRVKNVFSAGSEVFKGIKEGILSAFKTVVNYLIQGINNVIAVPFNAINDMLDRISGVDIGGFRPFEGLVSRFDVPQIPYLAKGGIVKKPTIAEIGEAGTEAVIPLERNKAGLKMLARLLSDEIRNVPKPKGVPGGAGANVVTNNYNFTQNNSSPKSLSRSEIYRQTKNLLRKLKREKDLT